MTAARALKQSPYTTYQVTSPIPMVYNPSGLQHTTISFAPIAAAASSYTGGHLTNVTNTSILYSRLLKPNATGGTLSNWSYGGHTTLDLINDRLAVMSPAGIAQYMTAITDSGTGKLMIAIEEGNNDHAQSKMSIRNVAPSNSQAGFQDNLTYMMDQLRSAWTLTGKPSNDLSFLLIGMYQKDPIDDPDGNEFIRGSASVMHDVALTASDTSFVDIHQFAPNWQTAYNLGYMVDPIHPSVSGGNYYGEGIFAQLVPEPTSTAFLITMSSLLIRRRNRKQS